jgi:hypothetical protein
MRNPRSIAVNGSIGGHDPPRFLGGLPGRYEHRLLPICCPDDADPNLRDDHLNSHRHQPSCMSCRVDDLRFLRTVGDRW